jgi:ankyrin repeat protein
MKSIWQNIEEGNIDEVRSYLAKGGNVNSEGAWGGTLLFSACLFQNKEIMELLLEHGAKIDHQEDAHHYTPLHLACKYGELETASLLVKHGASLTIKAEGRNAKQWAQSGNHFDIMEMIDSTQNGELEYTAVSGETVHSEG